MPTDNIGNSVKDMLEKRNFPTRGVVLARHTLRKKQPNPQPQSLVDFVKLHPANFAEWQCIQTQDTQTTRELLGCNYVVSFCGMQDGMKARFAGVFCNHSENPAKTLIIPRDLSPELARIYSSDEKPDVDRYFFQFCKVPGFADLEGEVIIDWNRPDPINWVQPLTPDFNPPIICRRERVAPFGDWR